VQTVANATAFIPVLIVFRRARVQLAPATVEAAVHELKQARRAPARLVIAGTHASLHRVSRVHVTPGTLVPCVLVFAQEPPSLELLPSLVLDMELAVRVRKEVVHACALMDTSAPPAPLNAPPAPHCLAQAMATAMLLLVCADAMPLGVARRVQ
jgi:hypothetical protein